MACLPAAGQQLVSRELPDAMLTVANEAMELRMKFLLFIRKELLGDYLPVPGTATVY